MRTLASLEGEYIIDNRGTPGVAPELVVAQGLPVKASQGLFEEACYTCSHCQCVVVKNRERTRPRGFCKKCNHIICDGCEAQYGASGHECKPFNALVDEYLESVERHNQATRTF